MAYMCVCSGNSPLPDGIRAGQPSVSSSWVAGLAANVLMLSDVGVSVWNTSILVSDYLSRSFCTGHRV
jgi:hypothetical protein